MEPKHIYTSTGAKFWRHPDQMISFLHGTGKTVISTHISLTGECNLNCSYCSVSKRKKHEQLDVETIVNYISKLIPRGLKSVIFTGGGEPTIHPDWNEIVTKLRLFNLKFGLITNGVGLENRNLEIFDWIRISVNYPSYSKLMSQDVPRFNMKPNCTMGLSLIYTGKNKELLVSDMLRIAQRYKAKYIRLLPDCLPEELSKAHREINDWILSHPMYDTSIFLHQQKYHGTPYTDYCPQAYFRPYLSEIDGGTVFPCDSIVLNNKSRKFEMKYAICKANEIGDFIDGKIKQLFDPSKDCKGCVFHENVNMLHDWTRGAHQFYRFTHTIEHEEFV